MCETLKINLAIPSQEAFSSSVSLNSPNPSNSLTNTLKDSGMFGSGELEPLTNELYYFVLPFWPAAGGKFWHFALQN